jgi:putative oxidoreductase
MNALIALLRTDGSRTLAVQRLILATVVFPYGARSLFGWFGGLGLHASVASFHAQLGMPRVVAVLLILFGTLGPIALALGLLTRVGAVAVSAVLVLLLATAYSPFAMLGLALSIPLVVRGAGAFSIDRMIVRQWETLPLRTEITSNELEVGRHVGQYEA